MKADLPTPQCPNEAQILTYSEGKLSPGMRAGLESHFVICNDCRSLLVLLTRFNNEPSENATPMTEAGVKKQTARILAFIENDEQKRSTSTQPSDRPVQIPRKKKGFFVSYPQLAMAALVICAVSAGLVTWQLSRQKSDTAAMQTLAKAMKGERRGETRISGGFEYSPYTATKGAKESDDLQLRQAVNKVKAAENDSDEVEARLALARVYLAFEKADQTQQALAILDQLKSMGIESPEFFNDHGVANYQIKKYDEAIEDFNKALQKMPAYPEALFNKALAEDRSGRYQDAKKSWQQFINMSPDAKWKEEAERRLNTLSNAPNQ
ncbi:MAG: tetratricopeptide repeat protein [Blastocatellia bacterium]